MSRGHTSGIVRNSDDAAATAPDGNDAATDLSPHEGYVRIEQVALRTGLTKRTLRYYEEIGLLPPPTRTDGNYRLYSDGDVAQLQRIKRLKELLGFSLAEIRELAGYEEEREHVRAELQRETNPAARLAWIRRVEDSTQRQLELIDEKLSGLTEMRASLRTRQARLRQLRAESEQALHTGQDMPS